MLSDDLDGRDGDEVGGSQEEGTHTHTQHTHTHVTNSWYTTLVGTNDAPVEKFCVLRE